MSDENRRGNPNPNPNPNPQSQSSKAPSTTTSNPSHATTPTPPSLASRIQTSAAGLAKSAFQPGSDTAQTLSSSTSSKAGPSSSSSNLHTARELSTAPNPQHHGGPSSAPQTFREPATESAFALPPLTEDEFQAHRTDDTLFHADQHEPTWKGKSRQDASHEFETAWRETRPAPPTEATDGSAVVSLLSDATFDPNFEDPTTVPDTELDVAAAPASLSAGEREALDSFRKGLGMDGGKDERPARLTGASLVPDIDTFLSQDGVIGGGMGGTALRDDVLARLPGASDWVGVQERYHDEVWGFLQPVLEAARDEIEKGQEGSGGEDGPAVRRLKMVLMHMKG